jgi:hypothetical protein
MLLGDHHSEERSVVASSQQSSIFASSFHVLRTIPTIATTTVLPQTRRQSRRVFSRVMNSGNNNDNNINNKYDYSSDDDKSYKRSYNNSHSYRNSSNNDNGFLSLSDDDDVSRQNDDDILSSTAAIATTTTTPTTVVSLKSSKDIYMKRFKLTSNIVISTTSYFTSKQIITSVNAVGYKNNNNIKDGAIGYEAAESAFAPGQQQLAVPVLAQSALLNTLPINNLLIGQLQGFIESFVQLLNPSDKQINQIKLNSSVLWSNLRINAQRATGMFLYNQVGTLVDRKLIYYL